MEKVKNKEKQMVQEITDYLNDFSFNSEKFAKEMAQKHPTLQQKFVKAVTEYLKIISEKNFYYDNRNRQAVNFAKDIQRAGLLEKYNFPMM